MIDWDFHSENSKTVSGVAWISGEADEIEDEELIRALVQYTNKRKE